MWGIRHGRWWMVQFALDGTLSLGIHIDPLRRFGDSGVYGPYVDLHFGPIVISVGNHPARANAWGLYSQGGIMRPESG
jgi:hypothetical protein